MKRHPIRTTGLSRDNYRPFCVNCGRFVSHVAFLKLDGTLVDFAYHYGRPQKDWRGLVAEARAPLVPA